MTEGAEAATRRKACRNCTAAKRRCLIRYPHCERCSKKGLECRYDLEPLIGNSITEPHRGRGDLGESGEFAVHCLLQKLSSTDEEGSRLSQVSTHDHREGIGFVVSTLCLIPSRAINQVPSVFIHPRLRLSRQDNWLATAVRDLRLSPHIHPSHENFQTLLQIKPGRGTLEDELVQVQALMLYLLVLMLGSNSKARTAARPYFDHLCDRIEHVESGAGNFDGQQLSPWQGWLFGESIRRTIVSAHILTCVFFKDVYEEPAKKVRMEALPFDDRVGLWQAETPQAWIAAAGEKRGRDVRMNLVSWHEFGCKRPSICMGEEGDMFLSMMLVSHNGIGCLQRPQFVA